MGVISNVRSALAPAAIRGALRASSTAPAPRIGRKGPPLRNPMVQPSANVVLVETLAMEKSVDRFIATLRRADRGDTGPLMDTFSDARDYDAHLDGVARKRAQSMMGRPIAFRPPEGLETDREALDIASKVRRVLLNESIKFRSMTQHLMSASVTGYAVSPLHWTTNARGEHVPHLRFAHSNRFGFHRDSLEIGFYEGTYRSGWNICPLVEYPDQFVAHVPMSGRSDYPWRRGPVRSCIVPSYIKRHGIAFWLVLAERFGMPQPFAKVAPGVDNDGNPDDSTVAVVQEALQNLGRYWSMVVSSDVEIDSIPGSGNVDADVHKLLIDWSEMTQSIALLGQNLTTKAEGGSLAAVESHRYVAGDIHLADAVELGETLTQQVVEPLVRYNWPGAPIPVCEISTGQKQIWKTEHVIQGICSPDEMRRTMGHEALPDGLGAKLREPAATPGAPGPKPDPATIGEDLEAA